MVETEAEGTVRVVSGLGRKNRTSGVNVFGPNLRGGFTTATGTSVAAAITAGACAQMVEWGMRRTPPRIFNNSELKALFIRGADRSRQALYPNREWGYGTLNVYQVFSSLNAP